MSIFPSEFEGIRLEVQDNLLDSLHVAADHEVVEALE